VVGNVKAQRVWALSLTFAALVIVCRENDAERHVGEMEFLHNDTKDDVELKLQVQDPGLQLAQRVWTFDLTGGAGARDLQPHARRARAAAQATTGAVTIA
jgi:hypothetical protein